MGRFWMVDFGFLIARSIVPRSYSTIRPRTMRSRLNLLLLTLLILAATAPATLAQQNFDNVQIEVIEVADGVHMLA